MKKFLSLILAFVMLIGMVPIHAFAMEAGPAEAISWSHTQTIMKSASADFRWELMNDNLMSVGAVGNALALNSGSIANGVLHNACYSLQNEVRLNHDAPWVLEWRSTGDWSGMLFGTSSQSPSEGLIYLFRDTGTKMFAFGEYDGSWNNYGIIFDCDMNVPHVFRLENRIAPDGSNAAHLLMDGVEIGEMNQYYVANQYQNETVDWANEKDIVFNSIGTTSHPVNGMQLEYLQIWENGHDHAYQAIVTTPTCTETGYTTYTCACGSNYTANLVAATGHSCGQWTQITAPTCDAEGQDKSICTVCHEVQYRDTRISGDLSKIQVSTSKTKDYFAGKTLLLLGDSITCGVGVTDSAKEVYGAIVGERLGMQVINKAVSGSGYCTGGVGPMSTNMTLIEENIKDADVITIMLGINDWNTAAKDGFWYGQSGYYEETYTCYELGEFGSTDTDTLYGAVRAWCEEILRIKAMTGYEDKQFVFITPVITSWNRSMLGSDRDWDQSKTNVHGYTLRQYCTAIMEVATYYGIPVFDANMYSGMYYRSTVDNNVAETGGDGIHPNAAGHVLIADALEEFLLEGYSYETRAVAWGGHSCVKGICEKCHFVQQNRVRYVGKTLSVLGDSISTFEGVSNDGNVNATVYGNAVYYQDGVQNMTRADTWWQQTVDVLNMELLLNNSWSGSCIYTHRAGTAGAYADRCVQLHNDRTNEEPDVIAVYLGINDYWNFKSTLGTEADIDYTQLITPNGNAYAYAEPTTAAESYAIMLHKMSHRYPKAQIYCFTILPVINLSAADQQLLEQFNATMSTIAEKFGAVTVDLYADSGIKTDGSYYAYITDGFVHPGPLGMDAITDVLVKMMLECVHDYTAVVTLPTCTEKGYTTHICVNCGDSYVDSYSDAVGHTYANPEFLWLADLSAASATATCACGHVETANCTIAWNSGPSFVQAVATAQMGKQTLTDRQKIEAIMVNQTVTVMLPRVLAEVKAMAVTYDANGRVISIDVINVTGNTVTLNVAEGDVRVYFLNNDYSSMAPAMQVMNGTASRIR